MKRQSALLDVSPNQYVANNPVLTQDQVRSRPRVRAVRHAVPLQETTLWSRRAVLAIKHISRPADSLANSNFKQALKRARLELEPDSDGGAFGELDGNFKNLLLAVEPDEPLVPCPMSRLLLRPSRLLRDYQLAEVLKMERMRGGLTCIEMGLGKTLIGLVVALRCVRRLTAEAAILGSARGVGDRDQVCLVLTPSDLVSDVWILEARTSFGQGKVKIGKLTPELSEQDVLDLEILVTTYDNIASLFKNAFPPGDSATATAAAATAARYKASKHKTQAWLFDLLFGVILADECHKFCNPETMWAKALGTLRSSRRFGFSGTPLQNRIEDVRTELEWALGKELVIKLDSDQLREYITSLDYSRAGVDLPKKDICTLLVSLGQRARALYDRVRLGQARMILKMTIMRQLAIAPYIVRECLVDHNFATKQSDPWLWDREGDAGLEAPKMQALKAKIHAVCVTERAQLLVFSTFAKALTLANRLVPEGVTSAVMTGDTGKKARRELVSKFKAKKLDLLFLTFKLGAEGHNFQNCHFELLMDRWYTDAANSQAEARTHRPGQEHEVEITQLVCDNSIDQHVDKIAATKGAMLKTLLNC